MYRIEFTTKNGEFTIKKAYLKEHISVSIIKDGICLYNTIVSDSIDITEWIEASILRYNTRLLKQDLGIKN